MNICMNIKICEMNFELKVKFSSNLKVTNDFGIKACLLNPKVVHNMVEIQFYLKMYVLIL